MNPIIFRAKRADNGEWVTGGSLIQFLDDGIRTFYMPAFGEKCIVTEDENGNITVLENNCIYKVQEKTVGIFIGLKDKKDNPVFEGDIIKTHYANAEKCDFVEEVVFYKGKFSAYSECEKGLKTWSHIYNGNNHLTSDKSVYMDSFEIIGNIFDNSIEDFEEEDDETNN